MRNVLWLSLLAIACGGFAQDCTRSVPVNVLTSETHQPVSFSPERLHASFRDSQIGSLSLEKLQSSRILLLLDVSASMEKQLLFSKVIFQLLLQKIPPGSSVAYGFFGRETHLAGGFTGDLQELAKATQALHTYPAKGRTALLDAVHEGLKLFQPPRPGDSILLITDGGENSSKDKESVMEKEVRESGVRIFAIMPLPLADSTVLLEEEFGPRWLQGFASKTGGIAFAIYHDWPQMDKKWLRLMAAMVQNFWLEGVGGGYLLSVKLPLSLNKPVHWKLRLDTSGDRSLKDASAIYPEKIIPCPSPSAEVH